MDNTPPDGAVPDSPDEHTHPASDPPARTKRERREQAVVDALRAYIRDHSTHLSGAMGDGATIDLRLRIEPGADNPVTFDPPLDAQLDTQMEDAFARPDMYRPGCVYCFRCDASTCAHSTPPQPSAVFAGYSSTGLPEWHDLHQALIETRDDRIDRLYARPPAVLSAIQLGRDLRKQQSRVFGRASRTYAILGQVIVGYLRADGDTHGVTVPDRLAVTFQAVETRTAAGRPAYRLNTLAGGLSAADWESLLRTAFLDTIAPAVAETASQLEQVERDVLAAREAARADAGRTRLREVPAMLRRLSRSLERGARRSQRRTRHAEGRRQHARPIHMALADAGRAADNELFYDEKRRTWVACGRQGRAHVFSEDGRHVTSFVLPSGGAAFRVRTNRWRTLQPDEAARFRGVLGIEHTTGG